MTIKEWIREQDISGISTFLLDDVRQAFPDYSAQGIKRELCRLSSENIVFHVYRGFYVIIPSQCAAKKVIPPIYYIDRLMAYLKKPYYVSLLNAAEIFGAVHQTPQELSITTVLPKSSVIMSKNNMLVWTYRKKIPSDFLIAKEFETGKFYYSNAELTAIDIVQYAQYIGGLSKATAILYKLAENLDFHGASKQLFKYSSIATLQRLGYIFDEILDQKEIADVLYEELLSYAIRFRHVLLCTHKPYNGTEISTRWKININSTIETDGIG